MYTSFFGLNERPFSITPDPRYLFMSERHGEALAHLIYGVTESGGFIQLTGEVGTGKTTLVRTLLLNRMPNNADVAVVLNPQQSAHEFVQTICGELHVPTPDKNSIKACIDALNEHLLAAHADGRRTILVVDEAQNLAPDVLEQVRLLTNLETSKQKLLQIILIGQPELRELLARTDLRQLAQRITGRYHLEPLSREETARYVEHRLTVAGALVEIFDAGAKREIFRITQGIPRLVNVICDRALLGAYSHEIRQINRRLVSRAAAEVSGKAEERTRWRWALPVIGAFAAIVVAAGYWPTREQATHSSQGAIAATPETNYSNPAATNPGGSGVSAELVASNIALAEEAPLLDVAEPVPNLAEPVASLDEQLIIAAGLTGRNTAFETLIELWQLDYQAGTGTVCEQAAATGMSCFFQRGSWSGLRQLDRPAILTLTDSRGNDHAVVLTSIENGVARLAVAGVNVTHRVDSISELWFGQYLLLWKPPNGISMSLAVGSQDQNVLWLRQSLAVIDEVYRSEPIDSDIYDGGLQQAVRAFQRDHRLRVDGVAGQQTQIIVNSLLAVDGTPRLTARSAAQQ
jgi:general secretion pathway protein A